MKLINFIMVLWLILLSICGIAYSIENSISLVPSAMPASAIVQYDVVGGGACSGVLVSPSWVLLIAHCVDRYSNRTIPNQRDVYITPTGGTYPIVRFKDASGRDPYFISVDRIVRVDGADTLTNSLALVHLVHPAPPWVEPIQLYRGDIPDPEERLEIWGFGTGSPDRGVGGVKVADYIWREIDQFWALCLKADPSRLRPGDSGGPILTNNNGRKEVVGVNWNEGCGSCSGTSPCGGRAAATFSINKDGHNNPVTLLLDRIITEPMGHGADSLDIEGDGKNEIVLYDADSGELRLLGIGEHTRFDVLLKDQVATGYKIMEVGDFDGDGSKREMVLYRGDTGELRIYAFEYTNGNYYLIPSERYTPLKNPLLPQEVSSFGATAATSGDFDGRLGTELALIDGPSSKVHIIDLATGQYLGNTTKSILGLATVFASGRFSGEDDRDWIAAYAPDKKIHFLKPTTTADGRLDFELINDAEILVSEPLGIVTHMMAGNYDGNEIDDILLHRSRHPSPGSSRSDWIITIFSDAGSGSTRILMDRVLEYRFIVCPANIIIPGNFDDDEFDEIALWQRAYTGTSQAMYVYSIDGTDSMTRLSGRYWNWENRWWSIMQ